MLRAYISAASAALFLAACGGKVAIDAPSSTGGAGGAPTTTSSTVTTTPTTTTTTTTSTTSTTTSSGSTGGCGHLAMPQGCATCTEAKCCSELIACDIGTNCWNQLVCLVDCGSNPNCTSSCAANLDPALQALAECLNNQCDIPSCNNPGQAICDSGLTAWQGSECGICLTISCCSAYEECAKDPQCFKCMSAPNAPPGCLQHPPFVAADVCRQKLCPHACP